MRSASAALLGLALAGLYADAALACVRPALPVFSLDAAAGGVDRQPPTRPVALGASVSRYNGSFCQSNGECVVSSCGSGGALELEFTPAVDDLALAQEIGYRLRWVEGSVPAALEAPLRHIALGTGVLRFELPFDAIPELDATFELIAIDRAGNESDASEPFRAAFDGCTRSIGFGGCAEDTGGRVTCADDTCFEAAPGSRLESGGCALGSRSAPARGTSPAGLGLLLALAAGALRRSRPARRQR